MFFKKNKKFDFALMIEDVEINFKNQEQVYDLVGALLSDKPVDVAEIYNGIVVIDRESKSIYIITKPTKKEKGKIIKIKTNLKNIKNLADDISEMAVNSGLFD